MKAWDKFFCFCCQREKPLADAKKTAHRKARGSKTICAACVGKKLGNKLYGHIDHHVHSQRSFTDGEIAVESRIPTEVLDAYAESVAE